MQDRQDDRLDSWKKIASYLKRDVSTVQRWERREGMPVHRHLHNKLGSVFAYRSELDAWWESRRAELAADEAGVAETEVAPASAAPGEISATEPRRASLRPWVVALGVVAAGVLIWAAIDARRGWRNPLADAKYRQLSDFAGSEQAVTVSRDGRYLAFLANRDGRVDAWVGEIGSGTYRNLTNGTLGQLVNPQLRTLTFSADSARLSIWSRRADGSQPGDVGLYSAPVTGGPLEPYSREAAEFDWSPDGKQFVYHTTAPGDPLFLSDGHTMPGRRIYEAPAGIHCHFPLWSPDGVFVYFVRGVPPDEWDIWRIRPNGEGLERITNQTARISHPVFIDSRTLLYLATDAEGAGPWIFGIDVERREPHRVSTELTRFTSLGASADGRQLAATMGRTHTSLWRVTVAADLTSASAPVSVLDDGTAPRVGPGFIVFVSSRGGTPGLYTLTNGAVRELWNGRGARVAGAPAIAPDGRRIAFVADAAHHTRLLTIDVDGSNLKTLSESLALQGRVAWSPDGRSLVVAALRDGQPQLMRFDASGGAPGALVPEYSIDPVWSPDGRFLVYSGPDVGTTFPLRAAAPDGRPYLLPGVMLTRGARRVAFMGSARDLVILRGDIGHRNLALVDLGSGEERPLAQLPADFDVRDFDVAGNGRELLLDRSQESSDLALIERRR
jgi:Tol biopolymer transport system component